MCQGLPCIGAEVRLVSDHLTETRQLVPKQARNGRVEGGASQPVSLSAILRLILAPEGFALVFHTG
jgi:hypothetical protein